jgi:alkylation response protein AidB-like acyl-CoA dehydrogenase
LLQQAYGRGNRTALFGTLLLRVIEMDFALNSDQKSLKKEIMHFLRDNANNGVQSGFSRCFWDECAQYGLVGLNTPEQYGGLGLDFQTCAVIMETIGYACEDSGFVFALTNHLWACQTIITALGDDRLKGKYLRRLSSGEAIGCFAVTESDSGSDVFGMRTTAIKEGDHYILNGNKVFISNAPIANVFLIVAKTCDEKNNWHFTAFVVEDDFEGFRVGQTIPKMGLESCPMAEVILTNCRVHKENIAGKPNKGMKVVNAALQMERVFEFASHIGAMQRQMEKCVKYVNEREQSGKKIKECQSMSNKIADMRVKIELARLYLYKTAWLLDHKKPAFLEASILKLFVSESYVSVCLDALQIHGAYGYATEYGVERELRDSLASTIYSGTSEVQRNIIFQLTDQL